MRFFGRLLVGLGNGFWVAKVGRRATRWSRTLRSELPGVGDLQRGDWRIGLRDLRLGWGIDWVEGFVKSGR